jgi:hypothetical protein
MMSLMFLLADRGDPAASCRMAYANPVSLLQCQYDVVDVFTGRERRPCGQLLYANLASPPRPADAAYCFVDEEYISNTCSHRRQANIIRHIQISFILSMYIFNIVKMLMQFISFTINFNHYH